MKLVLIKKDKEINLKSGKPSHHHHATGRVVKKAGFSSTGLTSRTNSGIDVDTLAGVGFFGDGGGLTLYNVHSGFY